MGKRVLSVFLVLVLCVSLLPVTARAADSDFAIENGVLTKYKGAGGDVTIPNSVTSIGERAFKGCYSLTHVTIPGSVTSIGESAFYGCSRLTGVTIGSGVTFIGDCAFEYCDSLTGIQVDAANPKYCSQDGVLFDKAKKTLIQCPGGKSGSYAIPGGVTSIGDDAFANCDSLTSVSIPGSVTSIGDYAFYYCDSLTSVSIPGSVTSIGDYAFYYCDSLTSVSIPGSVTSIGYYAFYHCDSLTSVTIPNSVTSIGVGAFRGCSSLTSVTIPNSVTYIGDDAFYGCDSLTDVYYADSEAQYDQISGYGKPSKQLAHFNSSGVIPTQADANVPVGQYCVHVIGENNEPLKDATVTWNDGVDLLIDITDAGGNASFDNLTIGTPLISVELTGYITWTNANSNWQKSADRYETVVLYPKSSGDYKLASAQYSAKPNFSSTVNLLVSTKKLNLKNDGNLIGDLTSGEFYIACSAAKTDGIVRYELWQNQAKIAESTTGQFDKLSVKRFSKGGGCFVRVVTADKQVDTHINLEFAENTVQKETGVSLMKSKIGVTVSDDVPFLGGSTFNVGGVGLLPVEIKATEDKVYLGFNAKIWESGDTSGNQAKGKFDNFKKSIESAKKANAVLGKRGGKGASAMMNSLMKMEPDFDLPGGSVKFNVVGYAEADWGSSTATGELYIVCKAETPTFGFTTWVVVVPVTVQISGYAELQAGGKVTYNWETATLTGEMPVTLELGLEAFGGVGVGTVVGVGAYGSANAEFGMQLFVDPFLKKIDLTGELGLKTYVGPFEYKRAFAHQTWHLYTANTVDSAALLSAAPAWNEGLYDASAYATDDLSYLAAESDWLGAVRGGSRLLAASAEAKTEFKSLLTDTYRNAQPVMVSSGDALYAAFVRADAESGSRYVVVTKSEDGISWTAPVRADADAILDDAPALCVDEDGTVWLVYARTTANQGDSLLTYAQNQEIVVGTIDPDTLTFTEHKTFHGSGYAHMQQLAVIDGQPVLMWADTALTDESSVLLPASGTICYAVHDGGVWSDAAELTSVNGTLTSVTLGEQNGELAAAYVSDGTLYCASAEETTELASDVSGRVRYGVLPETDEAAFLWNGNGMLCSSNGDEISAEGISHEYAVVGDKVYYSLASDNSANLAVLQYENGNWSLPIQLTGDSRYLENLSAARLNGSDYVFGMHTAVTITEDSVEDAKNLVVSRVMPVSDLRIDGVDYDDGNLTAGESVPVTVTVINVGDHTVNSIDLSLDGEPIKSETVELLPGQSVEIETEITCPSALTSYVFVVSETGESDYTPADNEYELNLGYADAALELDYQQIGTSKALVATVTNQGIDAASGSVIFYDADGNPVAESTFENLTSGDIAIASYAVTESFAGVDGGDVSAKVVLEQDELHAYNNEATMHILKSYAPTSIKSISKLQGGIAAEVVFGEDVHATVLCATYDNAGKMLCVESKTVDASEGETYTFDFAVEDAGEVKVFVLGGDHDPLCEAREPAMQTD